MKLLMRKVGGSTIDKAAVQEQEKNPKKIRNRPLFYCKVSFYGIINNRNITSVHNL